MSEDHPLRFLVIGGGPAGVTAATHAASLGAAVTLVESDIVGGAAHLWDCIPSKALVASALRLDSLRGASRLGIDGVGMPAVDMRTLSTRADAISDRLAAGTIDLLDSQGVQIITGRGRLTGPNSAVAVTESGELPLVFDVAVLSTGSRPWEPDWAAVDGERILTTRHAYHLPTVPEHLIVIGSGVTGVEFVHIFAAIGAKVSLLVSRQQVLPHRDPEVAAVLEEDFLERGVALFKGSRANSAVREGDGVVVTSEDGRRVTGSHVLLAVGSRPNSEGLGLDVAGVATEGGHVVVDEHQRTSVAGIYAAGDLTGQMPLSSVAAMQGRKIARHAMGLAVKPLDYTKVSQAVFTEPEIASVGLEEADARAAGRKVRITKVPFAANPRALIQGNPTGFVKVISDPATHVVLGGTIVGHHASELIGTLALAAQGGIRVDVLVETLMVHPSLAESLQDAAD
ncbi:MAG TPA: FAD-dependent oxidoreductase [Acidimicrobiia bacterium]|nr:FAD-dependent oxidoreductase [Acidimicrobiia bacterium]